MRATNVSAPARCNVMKSLPLRSNVALKIGSPTPFSTVRIDPQSGQEMLVRLTVRQDRWYDHNFIPNPPAAERVYVPDLETQVRARVALGWDGQPVPGASEARLREINRLQPGVK